MIWEMNFIMNKLPSVTLRHDYIYKEQVCNRQPGIPASVEVGVYYFIRKVLRNKAGQAFWMLMVILSHVMVTVFCWNCEIHNMSRAKVSSGWKGTLVTRSSRHFLSIQEDISVRCASSISCQRTQAPSHIS